MPPKSSSKKSAAAASWFYCDVCNVHITSKERETHEKVCPIEHINHVSVACTGLEYIWNSIIFTCSVERKTFSIEELVDMPSRYIDQLIFISEGAMRLAKLHVGQSVVIYMAEDASVAPLVRTVWPIPEKFLTTVFVTPEDLKNQWQQFKGTQLKIRGLSGKSLRIAKSVELELVNDTESSDFNEQQLHEVSRIVKQEIKNFVYTRGSIINLNFFNKMLQFRVSSCNAVDAENFIENTLEEALDNLHLKEREHWNFFQVAHKTQVKCLCNKNAVHVKDVHPETIEVTEADIGGLDEQLQIIKESLEIAFALINVPKGVKISRGMLVYGSTGCGKTLICEAMCNSMRQKDVNIIKINTSELFSKFLGETEKNLAMYFEKAYQVFPQPALIIIEDVNNLCPKYETNEIVKRVSVAFLGLLDALNSRKEAQRTFLLATTSKIDDLHAGLRRCGRFDSEIEISAPSPQGRAEILKCLLHKVDHNLNATDIEAIAAHTHGFVGADLSNLINSASLSALKSAQLQLQAKNITSCLAYIKPSAMREVLIENPNVRWSDIGGQQRLKLQLKQAIEWPLLHADKFKRLGIKPPRGLLMFGPPGCSKTMIAKALATESKLNFLSIKGPELFSMWVGESERAVREVFRKARQVAPSIVFFDEIDAISGERSDGSGGGSGTSVKERVLTQLLTEMDGVESLQNVTIVAATNRPDMIDKALLRPGRIDRIVYVGLPDKETRREIFRIKLKVMPLSADVDIEKLVENTEGYSGAEIQAVCHEAALRAIELSFDAVVVDWLQFEYALSVVKPRTSSELLRIYDDYMKKS